VSAEPQADGFCESIASTVMTVLADAFQLDPAEVQPGCQLVTDYGASANDWIRLREGLEDAFKLTIRPHHMVQWTDVAAVVKYIKQRVEAS